MNAAPPAETTPPAELGRRERRKLELRARVLEAAARLFEQQGFHATKVADICDDVDIAQKTFFNHFATKQDVLREIARYSLGQVLEQIEQARKAPGSGLERLGAFFEHVSDDADEAGPMHRELLTEILHVAHESSKPEDARRLQQAFGALIDDAAARGELAAGVDPRAATELVLGSYYALMFNWAHLEDYPLRARARAQVDLLARIFEPFPAPTRAAEE